MSVKNRSLRPGLNSARAPLCLPESPMTDASFHSTLSACAQKPTVWWAPLCRIASLFSLSENRSKPVITSKLTRAWDWMHAKYTLSATKRLRVTETVALGEKRFVAIVNVEGCEFLIGGGTAGISLLAYLVPQTESTEGCLRESGVEGGAR
jgi:hypothetical protein